MAVNERIAEHAMAFPGMPVRAAFTAACLVVASAAALADRFPAIKTFTVEQALGGWSAVQATHFADGAIYDQIVVKR
jgi:ABC-type sulfate transport system substrate-binding protein